MNICHIIAEFLLYPCEYRIVAIRRKKPTLFSYNGKALAILKTDKVRLKTHARV